ncbi:MAG: hypothetical protein JW902_03540 [Syntrophaceae bacterium]|nr:hypothetical protein [Syntrophaceae bacterium]
MAAETEATLREETQKALERMQNLDVAALPREGELGQKFNFINAVDPTERLVKLYSRLPISVLEDLPENQLKQIRDRANQDYNRIDEILKFDPTQQNAIQVRENYITQIINSYKDAFSALHPYISYSLYKTADFKRLEGDARAALQAIKDQGSELTVQLKTYLDSAKKILEEIRKVAEEQGVTQQAIYFQKSADNHEFQADIWRKYTVRVAIGLTCYALLSILFHKISWLDPSNTYQAIQIGISKILVFTVISYMLYICAKNFISHKHNAIVDRHRQNALMTYKALVEAAGDTPNREIVLVQAAACIFGPQGTGYTSDSVPQPPSAQSVVEFLCRPLSGK